MLRTLALLTFLLCGACAAPKRPYVVLSEVGPTNPLAWFSDGPDVAYIAINPTKWKFKGVLRCRGTKEEFPLELEPGEQKALGLGRVLNRDEFANSCWLKRKP